jgi:hypothetical protein
MASTTSYSTDLASGHATHPTTALLQAQEDSDLGVQAPTVLADGGPLDLVSMPFSEQSKTIQGGPANSAPGIRSFVCARCRSKHLKCDGAMPCSRCREDSGECFYTMSRRGWKGPRKRKAEPNNDRRSVSYGTFTRGVKIIALSNVNILLARSIDDGIVLLGLREPSLGLPGESKLFIGTVSTPNPREIP